MMLDVQNLCSDQQSVAIAVGSVLSDNSIDLGAAVTDVNGNTVRSDLGRSDLEIFCQVTTEIDSVAESGTFKVELVTADDAALTTNLTVLTATAAIAENTCIPGYMFRLGKFPPGVSQRYLGFRYTVAVADMATGKVSAGLATQLQLDAFATP